MDELEQFLETNKSKINELKASYGELAVVQSGWGPICVFRKPNFQDLLKFNAEHEYSENPVMKAWAPVKFIEQVVVLPDAKEFTALRDRYGYDFVSNLAAEVQRQFRPPEVKTNSKKI